MTDESAGSFESVSDIVSVATGVVATGQELGESNTKAKLITPFLRTLGWHVYDNSEVLLEYSGEQQFNDRADYALFGPDGVYAVVEAKQIGEPLDSYKSQVRKYMRLFGADWGLLTNGECYIILQATNDGGEAVIESVTLTDLPDSAHITNLTRETAYTDSTEATASDTEYPTVSKDAQEEIELFVERKRDVDDRTRQQSEFGPLYDSLIDSLAPSVPGSETLKLGILLSLAGGVRKELDDGTMIRGANHLLIVHDPGTRVPSLAKATAALAPLDAYLAADSAPDGLLTASTDTDPSSVSNFSTERLARTTHAIVTRFTDLSNDELNHLTQALAAEPPTALREDSESRRTTTSVIATSTPAYGRFDQYEPIVDQLDVSPDHLAQFDLIYTVTDKPDEWADRERAEETLQTHHDRGMKTRNAKVDDDPHHTTEPATDATEPNLDSALFSQYVTHIRQIQPTLTEAAKTTIRDFYVDLRSQGAEEDAPTPIGEQRLESLVRLAEASARLRLSETVDAEDAERAITLLRRSLQEVGMDPETGELDADVIQTGTTNQEDTSIDSDLLYLEDGEIKGLKELIAVIEEDSDEGAPVDRVVNTASECGFDSSRVRHGIDQLKQKGEVYEPRTDHLRTT